MSFAAMAAGTVLGALVSTGREWTCVETLLGAASLFGIALGIGAVSGFAAALVAVYAMIRRSRAAPA